MGWYQLSRQFWRFVGETIHQIECFSKIIVPLTQLTSKDQPLSGQRGVKQKFLWLKSKD